MTTKLDAPQDVAELNSSTETALYNWMLYGPDDMGESLIFKAFTNSLVPLLSTSPKDGVALIERASKYAFEHVKRRRLYVVASSLVTLLAESGTLEMFRNLEDGNYKLATLLALTVQQMDHFDKTEVHNTETAICILTRTDFKFSRNYNKHREQTFDALFGRAWTALYMDDLMGPDAVLSTLLQARAPLVFQENQNPNINMPNDLSTL